MGQWSEGTMLYGGPGLHCQVFWAREQPGDHSTCPLQRGAGQKRDCSELLQLVAGRGENPVRSSLRPPCGA